MSLAGLGELLDAIAERRQRDMQMVFGKEFLTQSPPPPPPDHRNGKQVVAYPDRPPVPRGLSSGAVPASVAERWPTAPPMPPDRIIESSEPRRYRMRHNGPRSVETIRHNMKAKAAAERSIAGLPDCRGAACDGMCGNPDCVGDRAMRRAAARIQPRWRIAVYVAAMCSVVAGGAVLQLHPIVAGGLSFATSSVLFSWAFWKRN